MLLVQFADTALKDHDIVIIEQSKSKRRIYIRASARGYNVKVIIIIIKRYFKCGAFKMQNYTKLSIKLAVHCIVD
jgi:hypothetical protein